MDLGLVKCPAEIEVDLEDTEIYAHSFYVIPTYFKAGNDEKP